jgi:glutaredoxin 3
MLDIHLYTTRVCPYCVRAKQLLDSKKFDYRETSVDGSPQLRTEMMNRSGRQTVPQIWIGDSHIGGCDELWALERSGQLDALLEAEQQKS